MYLIKYIIDKYLFLWYIFVKQRQKSARKQEAAHLDVFPGVSSFLFCLGFGGVERGESTGAGTDNRSI